jgi:hypothetical protein
LIRTMALEVCGRRENGLRNGFETTQNVFQLEDMSPSSSRGSDSFYVKQMKLRYKPLRCGIEPGKTMNHLPKANGIATEV